MKDEGIPTDDLQQYSEPKITEWQLPANVHFTAEGYAGAEINSFWWFVFKGCPNRAAFLAFWFGTF